MIDLSQERALEEFRVLRDEVGSYDKRLLRKPFVVIGTKIDLCDTTPDELRRELSLNEEIPVVTVCAHTNGGIDQLRQILVALSRRTDETAAELANG